MYFLSEGIRSQIAVWAGEFLEKKNKHIVLIWSMHQ